MMLATSSHASASDRSHLNESNTYDVVISDTELQPSDMDSSYQGGSSYCERMNHTMYQLQCRHRPIVTYLIYGVFLASALNSIRLEEYIKNDLFSTLQVDTHVALKYKAIGLMDQFEAYQLQMENNYLHDQADAVLEKKFADEEKKQNDIQEAELLYNESNYYMNLVNILKHFQEKIAIKLNRTESELSEVTYNLTQEENKEISLLNKIKNMTSWSQNDWFCSQAPNFCEWVDNVVDLRRQANNEGALMLHDLDVWKNLTRDEANEVFHLVNSNIWMEQYDDIASTLYIAAQQYEIDAQILATAIVHDNATYDALSDAMNVTDAREQKMSLYFQENTNKANMFFTKAEVGRQKVYESYQYAIAFAIICLFYFGYRLATQTIMKLIKYPFENDRFIVEQPAHIIVEKVHDQWNGRTMSNFVQHVCIFMTTVGFLNIQYNNLISSPQASGIVVSFIFLASIIQTIALNFLPHLMDMLPSWILHEQHQNGNVVDTSIPIWHIIKYSLMRFLLLFGLFTLEFLVIWLFAPGYVFNSVVCDFWTHWYVRLGVVCSILIHVMFFENILDEQRGSLDGGEHSTVCSVESHDDEVSFGGNEYNRAVDITSDVQSSEKTPLVMKSQMLPSKPPLIEGCPGHESTSQCTTWWPFLLLHDSVSRSAVTSNVDTGSCTQLSQPLTVTPFYVNFHDDLAKLVVATDVFVVASSIYVIRNLLIILCSFNGYSLITSMYHVGTIVAMIILSMIVTITLIHIVLYLAASFWLESKFEQNDNCTVWNDYSRTAKGIIVENYSV
jgi:hypothetical protein